MEKGDREMKLRERVTHLEKCFDEQIVIDRLRENVDSLKKEMEAVKDYLGIKVETYRVLATPTDPNKEEVKQ